MDASGDERDLSRRTTARIASWAITSFARALTAVQAVWLGADSEEDEMRPRVYFANHASHGDFILVWAVLPPRLRRRTRPVAGADYWGKGSVRRYLGAEVFRAVLIDRTAPAEGGDPIARMSAALSAGDSLILFPEGTRNLTEDPLLPFRSGLYRLALACPGVDLVPVWIENLNRVLPKGAIIPVPLMCKVTFGAALRRGAAEDKDDFLARARDALLSLKPGLEAA